MLRIILRNRSLRRRKIVSLRELNSKITTLIINIKSLFLRFNAIIINNINIIKVYSSIRIILRIIKYIIKIAIREKIKLNTRR